MKTILKLIMILSIIIPSMSVAIEAEVAVIKTIKIKDGKFGVITLNIFCLEDQIFITNGKEFKPLTTHDTKTIIKCKDFNPSKN